MMHASFLLLFSALAAAALKSRLISVERRQPPAIAALRLHRIGDLALPLHEEGVLQSACASYDFHLLEEQDLDAACKHLLSCFYTKRVVLDYTYTEGIERQILQAANSAFDKFFRLDAYLTYLLGFRLRLRDRLSTPNLRPSLDSCVIAATVAGDADGEIVGLVEMSLERSDGYLPEPLPLIRLGSYTDASLQPYVCNLCVAAPHRKAGLARALMGVVEGAARRWAKDCVFLHVKCDNVAASALYRGLGYSNMTSSDSGAPVIYHLVKRLPRP